MEIVEILTATVLSGSVITAIVASFTALRATRRESNLLLKREACLAALELVNKVYSNLTWSEGGAALPVQPQSRPSIAAIRRCHNELAITCKDPEVVYNFLSCFGLHANGQEKGPAEALQDFRDSVRSELFGGGKLKHDPNLTFIGVVGAAEAEDGAAQQSDS